MAAKTAANSFGYGMCNPVIRKMAKKSSTLESDGTEATYQGVAGKTVYFLICCIIGIVAFFGLHQYLIQNAGAYGGAITINDMENLKDIISIETCGIEALFLQVLELSYCLHHYSHGSFVLPFQS